VPFKGLRGWFGWLFYKVREEWPGKECGALMGKDEKEKEIRKDKVREKNSPATRKKQHLIRRRIEGLKNILVV